MATTDIRGRRDVTWETTVSFWAFDFIWNTRADVTENWRITHFWEHKLVGTILWYLLGSILELKFMKESDFKQFFELPEKCMELLSLTMLLSNSGLYSVAKLYIDRNIIKYRTDPRPCYVLNLQRKLFIVANNRIHIRSWPAKFCRVAGGRGGWLRRGTGRPNFPAFCYNCAKLASVDVLRVSLASSFSLF